MKFNISAASFSPAHFAAAVAALLVSYGSSAVIIFQAAQAFGATDAQITSWFTIIGLVCGVLTLGLSVRYKAPVMMAWCTPGAALMAGMSGISLNEAVAGFIFAGGLMLLVSAAGWFDRLVRLIPASLAAAMLAGILINFGSRVFTAMQGQTVLVLLMLSTYLLSKIRMPRYSILLMLLVGFGYAAAAGLLDWSRLQWNAPYLEWVSPVFHIGPIISVGVPLFIASLATQNVPGMAIMRSYGYHTPAKPLINSSAAATVVTGGRRLGMISARPKRRAVSGTTAARAAPSRTCRCQSSGRVMVRVSMGAVMGGYCPIADCRFLWGWAYPRPDTFWMHWRNVRNSSFDSYLSTCCLRQRPFTPTHNRMDMHRTAAALHGAPPQSPPWREAVTSFSIAYRALCTCFNGRSGYQSTLPPSAPSLSLCI